MARPLRRIWVPRQYARRRHRTWIQSMTLATLGWACWFVALAWSRFSPSTSPSVALVGSIAGVFAVLGLLLALFTIRARRSWLLFVTIPLFANASLLCLPWLAHELGAGR